MEIIPTTGGFDQSGDKFRYIMGVDVAVTQEQHATGGRIFIHGICFHVKPRISKYSPPPFKRLF
jgi:hypothetical protein